MASLGTGRSQSSSNGSDKDRYTSGHQRTKPEDKLGDFQFHAAASVKIQQNIHALNKGCFITSPQMYTIGIDLSQKGIDTTRFSSNHQNVEAEDNHNNLQLQEAISFTPQQHSQALRWARLIASQHFPFSNKPKYNPNSLPDCMKKEYEYLAPSCYDGSAKLSTSHLMSGRKFYSMTKTDYEAKSCIFGHKNGANVERGDINTTASATCENAAGLKANKAEVTAKKIKGTYGPNTELAKNSLSKAEAETKKQCQGLSRVSQEVREENNTPGTVTDAQFTQKTQEHKKMIKATGSQKDTKEKKWMQMFKALQDYAEKYGNCIVPRGYDDNLKLATWVGLQRKQYNLKQMRRPSHISEERISLLNGLGFTWNAKEATWDRRFEELKEYKGRFGDCTVTVSEDFPQLGRWVRFP